MKQWKATERIFGGQDVILMEIGGGRKGEMTLEPEEDMVFDVEKRM